MLGKIQIKNIILFSLVIHLTAAYFSVGFHHPDEFYYGINYAFLKAGLFPEYIPSWEYVEKIRPWSMPAIFYLFIKFFSVFTEDKLLLVSLLRFSSSLFSFGAHLFFFKSFVNYYNLNDLPKKYFAILNFLLWPIVFMNVRTSSENWSTSFLLIAVSLFTLERFRAYFFSGILFGLSFGLRFQTGLISFVIGVGALVTKKIRPKEFLILSSGILLGLTLSILIDFWGEGAKVFTFINYFNQNLIQDKLSSFGISPWWEYFKLIVVKLSPFIGIPLLISLPIYLKKRKGDFFVWSAVIFLVIHSCLGHKEFRFIYSALPFALVPLSLWLSEIRKIWQRLFLIANLVGLLIISFKASYTPYKFYEFLWHEKSIDKVYLFPAKDGSVPNFDLNLILREELEVATFSLQVTGSVNLFTTKFSQLGELASSIHLEECELLYSSYPQWLFRFNYFNWLKKSNVWALSRCKIASSK